MSTLQAPLAKSIPPLSKKKASTRITRSISFEQKLLAHVKKVARANKRTPNWIINEMVRKDLEESSQ